MSPRRPRKHTAFFVSICVGLIPACDSPATLAGSDMGASGSSVSGRAGDADTGPKQPSRGSGGTGGDAIGGSGGSGSSAGIPDPRESAGGSGSSAFGGAGGAERDAGPCMRLYNAAAISVGGSAQSCALLDDGRVVCWGDDPTDKSPSSHEPRVIDGIDKASAIALGSSHGCALQDGSVLCWGSNQYSQLADPTVISRSEARAVPLLADAVAIAAAGQATCALRANDDLYCWGDTRAFPTAMALEPTALEPVYVLGQVKRISLGSRHACVVRSSGEVFCWGGNEAGQLGNGGSTDSQTPVATGVTDAIAVSSGEDHSCALTSAGAVDCWGNGARGQLGNGQYGIRSTKPVRALDLQDVTSVAAGNGFTCATRADRQIACWGAPAFFADVGFDESAVPVTTMMAGELALGTIHSCVRTPDESVVCFGTNYDGQLGWDRNDPRQRERTLPVSGFGCP